MLRKIALIPVLFCIAILAFQARAQEAGVVLAMANLNRPYDPVVLIGADLGDFVKERKPPCESQLRVMAWKNGAWEVIPFQIDEKKRFTKVGGLKRDLVYKDEPDYVLNRNRENSPDYYCRFDNDDELVFMARDAGDRIAKTAWPQNVERGVEILLADPNGSGNAWVYAFYFKDAPPVSPRRYVNYDAGADEVRTDSYVVSYAKRIPLFFNNLAVPPSNNGSGADIVDMQKIRIRVRIAGGFFDYILTNLDFFGKLTGVVAGPVRVVRQTRTKLEYFVFAGRYHKQALYYYAEFFEQSLDFKHHFPMKEGMYDLTFRVTADLNPGVHGMRIITEKNRDGVVADGALSEEEKNLNYGPAPWVAFDGPAGRFIQYVALPQNAGANVWPDFYYLDDLTRPDPPERYPGQFGNAGFAVHHLQKINRGPQWAHLAYFFPSKIDDQRITDAGVVFERPLEARVGEMTITQRVPAGPVPPDTRPASAAPQASYVVKKDEAPTKGFFPQIMIDPNLGNGTGLGYVDRDLFHTGTDIDSFFIVSDRLFFVGHIILNQWPFLPKTQDMKVWVEFQDHPNRFFFGVGNDTPESHETIYHWQQVLAFVSFTQLINRKYGARATAGFKNTEIGPGKWFGGGDKWTLQQKFGFADDIEGKRFGNAPFGIEGGMSNYIQLAFFRDTRDDTFNPHHGNYEELRVDWVNPALGSNYNFTRLGFEAKAFWAPRLINRSDWHPNNPWVALFFGADKDRIFAARIAVDRIEAPKVNFRGEQVLDVPFFEQGFIGDSFNNRGYYWARYVDRDRLYLNLEYRAVMWKMWIIVLFYDTGRVFNDMGDEDEWRKTRWESYHHTVGFGLRGIFPAQLMMRMDYGFSAEHPNGIIYGNAYHTF